MRSSCDFRSLCRLGGDWWSEMSWLPLQRIFSVGELPWWLINDWSICSDCRSLVIDRSLVTFAFAEELLRDAVFLLSAGDWLLSFAEKDTLLRFLSYEKLCQCTWIPRHWNFPYTWSRFFVLSLPACALAGREELCNFPSKVQNMEHVTDAAQMLHNCTIEVFEGAAFVALARCPW